MHSFGLFAMISHKFKCIFIHIPKNAGTSIENKLCKEDNKTSLFPDHRTILDLEPITIYKLINTYKYDNFFSLLRRVKYYIIKNKIGTCYSKTTGTVYHNYFKFTFVRNPWSRAYSWYRNIIKDFTYLSRYKIPTTCTFEDFVKNYLIYQPALRSQLYWLRDSNGLVPIDFIGKFENLEDDFLKIANYIGLKDGLLPKIRYTGKSSFYKEAYNDHIKDIIWKRYKEEIEYFGYEFEK